jgi:hypothetical protein
MLKFIEVASWEENEKQIQEFAEYPPKFQMLKVNHSTLYAPSDGELVFRCEFSANSGFTFVNFDIRYEFSFQDEEELKEYYDSLDDREFIFQDLNNNSQEFQTFRQKLKTAVKIQENISSVTSMFLKSYPEAERFSLGGGISVYGGNFKFISKTKRQCVFRVEMFEGEWAIHVSLSVGGNEILSEFYDDVDDSLVSQIESVIAQYGSRGV